jgi:hypothetical protein
MSIWQSGFGNVFSYFFQKYRKYVSETLLLLLLRNKYQEYPYNLGFK